MYKPRSKHAAFRIRGARARRRTGRDIDVSGTIHSRRYAQDLKTRGKKIAKSKFKIHRPYHERPNYVMVNSKTGVVVGNMRAEKGQLTPEFRRVMGMVHGKDVVFIRGPRQTRGTVILSAVKQFLSSNDPGRKCHRAVRIPPTKSTSVSRKIRALVKQGYSPAYAAKKAYHPGRDPGPKRQVKHLTTAERKRLSPSQFALPDRRALPIHDARHTRNAAARLEQMKKRGTVTSSEYHKARSRIEKAEAHFKIGAYRKPRGKHARARITKALARKRKRHGRDPGQKRLSDRERAEWVSNDEGLYDWYKSTRMPLAKFVKTHRQELDKLILPMLMGKRRQHYLKYG